MSLLTRQWRMLEVLLENLNDSRPGLMSASEIAGHLNLPLTETRKILKSMHQTGVVEIDMEAEHCLITGRGVALIKSGSA